MSDQWWIARATLGDGRDLFVVPLTYGRARLTVGRGEMCYSDAW
ncbi:MAG: hypothetical protein ABIS21_03195 [Acidimicrobiales bacterium]